MKKINEIRDYLIKHRTDEDGDLDLSDLDFREFDGDIVLDKMKSKKTISNSFQDADIIWNNNQKANKIWNAWQEAKEIRNTWQEAEKIRNANQKANKISNAWQEAKEIRNTKSRLKAFLNRLLTRLATIFFLLTIRAFVVICIVIGLPIWFVTGKAYLTDWSIRLMDKLLDTYFKAQNN